MYVHGFPKENPCMNTFFVIVPKQLNTRQDQPLTPAEQEILAPFVKRAAFDFHGMPSIQVRSHARVRAFMQVASLGSDFVFERQMRRKVHLVRDILEWTIHRLSKSSTRRGKQMCIDA